MSKLYGLIVRWLFVSRNGIKMQFLSVVGFKSSTLTVYCLSSWFVHQKQKTYSNLCVLCWLSHLSWFEGPKYIPPSFWPQVRNHDVRSKMSKNWFFRSFMALMAVSEWAAGWETSSCKIFLFFRWKWLDSLQHRLKSERHWEYHSRLEWWQLYWVKTLPCWVSAWSFARCWSAKDRCSPFP